MKATALPISEDQECYWLVEYLDILRSQGKVVMYSHIANETYIKSWSVRVKYRKLGKSAGFPDYIVVMPEKVLFLEMKRAKGGQVSPEQKLWIEALNKAGAYAYICKGFTAAKEAIEKHL